MTLIFSARLTAADSKRHIPHHFAVPKNCTRLSIRHRYDPQRKNGRSHLLTLTLFDPNGFRGAGHRGGGEQTVEIGVGKATPGYLPGPLPAGDWTLQVDTHMVLPDQEVSYEIEVELELDAAEEVYTAPTSPPAFDRVNDEQAGWYRGDLHAHSLHSDAAWSAADLVAAARSANLDFVTLTDHNTVSSLAEIANLGSPDLLTMGGLELTTFWGHALCLGVDEWIDWRVDRNGAGMNQIAQEMYAAGKLFVMAHPKDAGDPLCTGCRWLYDEMMPGAARIVEIWNGAWMAPGRSSRKNEDGLNLWYRWLNEGHRLVATAGSDAHGPAHYAARPGFNVIYAERLSQAALLDGIAAGQLYLSRAPMLSLRATAESGAQADIGHQLAVEENEESTVRLSWSGADGVSAVRLVQNGEVTHMSWLGDSGEMDWSIDAATKWVLVELRDERGEMQAITNPIYVVHR